MSSNYQISQNMKKAGISPELAKDSVKAESFPIVPEVRADIQSKELNTMTPICLILPEIKALNAMQMIARYFVYPLQRSTYAGGYVEFMDFLCSEEPHIATDSDIQGFNYAKHVFIDSHIAGLDEKNSRYTFREQSRFEQYVIRSHYQSFRRFSFILPCRPDQLRFASSEFKDFLTTNYKMYEDTSRGVKR